jgi:hypothetical protein
MRPSTGQGIGGLLIALLAAGCATPHDAMTQYETPLTSPGAQFAALPAAVQNTIRTQTGAAEIAHIVKDRSSGHLIYKTVFENDEVYPPLYIAPDGSVLTPDMRVAVGAVRDETTMLAGAGASGLRLADLPEPVVRTMDQFAPRTEVATLDKETWGNRVVYIVSFKDEHKPKLYVAADGTILRDVQR